MPSLKGHTCGDPLGFTVGKEIYVDRDCMLACLGSGSVEHMHAVTCTLCGLSMSSILIGMVAVNPWFNQVQEE